MNEHYREFSTLADASEAAAALIRQGVFQALQKKDRAAIALAGGSTPRLLYRLLATPSVHPILPWESVHLFWGDERCVPFDHPASNFAMAWEQFGDSVVIPADNVHPIRGELQPPERAAEIYEQEMRDFFAMPAGKKGFPAFDIVLLGIGSDGHTASLFPESAALEEKSRWTVAVQPPLTASPAVCRITFTLPLINHANTVIFLAAGADKLEICRSIHQNHRKNIQKYPAAMVQPKEKSYWFLALTSE